MTRKPADWWKIPIDVDIEVGPNYGELDQKQAYAVGLEGRWNAHCVCA
jgi:hypothetical protein